MKSLGIAAPAERYLKIGAVIPSFAPINASTRLLLLQILGRPAEKPFIPRPPFSLFSRLS